MAIKDEFELVDKRINKLLAEYKFDSREYETLGMLDEYDALKIIDGSIKTVRKALEIITKDYSLNKKEIEEINRNLDKIRKKLENEVLFEDIIVHGYGNDISGEKTFEEASRDFKYKTREKLNVLAIQKMRIKNYKARKGVENWKAWLPIVISIGSLIISVISLIRGGSR